MNSSVLSAFLVLTLLTLAVATPPGIANHPSHATCKIKKYKHCYNLEHVCPKFCPDSCTVECASCKPICGDGSTPYPDPEPQPEPTPGPEPEPQPPTPTTPTPPTPTPPSDDDAEAAAKRAKCENKYYPQCYGTEFVCPKACGGDGGCEVDCVTCKPVCKCDKPGSVCQDPRFIGGDGLMFYFHGKKDRDFCLISDQNLHINGHFIGKRSPKMTRDFTWVQSIALLFGSHRLYLGALKTASWDDSVDRLSVSFDGRAVSLPQMDGAAWTSSPVVSPAVTIRRISSDSNNLEVQVEGLLKITARVVPITSEDSRVHGYNITADDCLAHLDLGFKFYGLSNAVHGVLGQTYRSDYVSRVKIGASMPVMGGDREFQTSGLFAPDCAAARFTGLAVTGSTADDLPELRCASGLDGRGVVCKR